MGKKKKTHYLNNKDFERTIKEYLEDPDANIDSLVEQLDLLISNILSSFKFKVDYDDAKQECFLLTLKVLKNFTPEKGSAFNYFTTVILNNLRLMYTKNKKYCEKIQEFKDQKIRSFLDND
jgi:DNA-directed RNA polymerase specialized sigma subunit